VTRNIATGIFVAHRGHLARTPGGVQACTQEYLAVIDAAGIKVRICPLSGDRRLSTRLFRSLLPSAYFRPASLSSIDDLNQLILETTPDFVFLNQVSLAVLGRGLKRQLPPKSKIVLLSHGLESTDLLHLIRLRTRLPLNSRLRPSPAVALGATILSESALRGYIDIVCTLSEFDATLERWVGADCVDWLPRTVQSAPLSWAPKGNRLGFVGTLDHAPNIEGLVCVLEELQAIDVGSLRIRMVGGPTRIGEWLSSKFKVLDYLGSLNDEDLKLEAQTWNAFLNPIFCHARGCSTKLATAIAWEIPVVTTEIGHRGYLWKAGNLIIANDAATFARRCVDLLSFDTARKARLDVAKVAETSPTIDEVAARMRVVLGL
jgi:Glycosyl transferases group 1